MYKRTALFYLGAALLISSCSVKESRWPCPCYLVIEPHGIGDVPPTRQVLMKVYPDNGLEAELTGKLAWEKIISGDYDMHVSKGQKLACGIEGLRTQYLSGTAAIIPEGEQADSLYASCAAVDCTGEEAVVPVYHNKQFASVFLKMESIPGEAYPFDMMIAGNVNGINLLSLAPHKGLFSYRCHEMGKSGEFRFRVPRQSDDSLVLHLLEKGADTSSKPVDSLPLGQLVKESGYRWDTESLEDIYIGVDYAQAGIRISINDWETILELNEQI